MPSRALRILLSLTLVIRALASSAEGLHHDETVFHMSNSFAFAESSSKSMILNNANHNHVAGTLSLNSTKRSLRIRSFDSPRLIPRPTYSSEEGLRLPTQQFRIQSPNVPPRYSFDSTTSAPNITDRLTLLNLAWASWDAYHPLPSEGRWYDLDGVNWTSRFGWKPWEDGLRGHLFLSSDSSKGIIVFKGTSISQLGSKNTHTSKRDRLNDNLLFSCCCANVPWRVETTHPCDCKMSGGKCCSSCLTEALREEETYYNNAKMVVHYFQHKYARTSFWLTGHSLGGSIASLVGIHFGLPTVTFEAPGERLAARRMGLVFDPTNNSTIPDGHLPTNDELMHITHVYNNIDPLAMGQCTGALSLCAQAGYAMESRCHNGRVIMYDLKAERKKIQEREVISENRGEAEEMDANLWELNLSKHRMQEVIKMLENNETVVPEAVEQTDCEDCTSWEFGEYDEIDKKWWRKLLGGIFGGRTLLLGV